MILFKNFQLKNLSFQWSLIKYNDQFFFFFFLEIGLLSLSFN